MNRVAAAKSLHIMKEIFQRLREAFPAQEMEIVPALAAGGFFAAAFLHWLMK